MDFLFVEYNMTAGPNLVITYLCASMRKSIPTSAYMD